MRSHVAILLFCCLVGCSDSGLVEAEAARKAALEAKLAGARKEFSAFIEEAAQAAQLLDAHPAKETIEAEGKKLRDLLDRAGNICPENDTMATLADDGRRVMKFYDTCLGMAIHQGKRTDITPEAARKYLDATCQGNAEAIRQLIEIMKKNMRP